MAKNDCETLVKQERFIVKVLQNTNSSSKSVWNIVSSKPFELKLQSVLSNPDKTIKKTKN